MDDVLKAPSTVVEAMAQGRRASTAATGARPSSGDDELRDRRVRALVCFASRGGRTAAIADAVGAHLEAEGVEVRVLPVERVGLEEVATADLLVVGTWVDGLVVAGVRPAPAMRDWLARLPRLTGTPTALFCTYGVHPRRALDLMAEAVGTRGAKVVAGASFRRRYDVRAVTRFADRLLPTLCRPSRPATGAPVVRDPR